MEEELQNEETNNQQTPLQHAIRFGAILGVISAIIGLLLYVVDPTLMIKWWFGLIMIAVSLGFIIYAGITYRKSIGGYIEFGPAFIHGFVTFAIAGLIGTVMNLLLYTVIDPELPEVLTDAAVEQAMSMAESFGAPPEAMEQAAENARAQTEGQFTPMGVAKSYFISLIFYAILSLITALIVRRREKVSDVY
jgi:hypothetical protein